MTSPDPTVSPTPLNEVTPPAEVAITAADLALSFGDYDEAYKLYTGALPQNTDHYKAAALYGQGLVYLKQEDYFQSTRILEDLIQKYPTTLPAIRAQLLLAQIALAQGLDDTALRWFSAYAAARPGVIDSYVYEEIGDLLEASGRTSEAFDAYKTAYLAASPEDNLTLARKVADEYAAQGETQSAIDIYKSIYHQSSSGYTQASMDLLIGRILQAEGNQAEAFTYYQDAVNNFPYAYDSYTSLVALLNSDQQVSDLQRGLINYHIGQFPLAIEALDRFISVSNVDVDKALYYKGLALREQGLVLAGISSAERTQANYAGGTDEDKEAIRVWNELLTVYPASAYRIDAIEAIIDTQYRYLGQIQLAIDTAIHRASELHSGEEAPRLLEIAAGYQLFDNQKRAAADSWTRIALEFPSSERAFNGLFFGGTTYFDLGLYENAANNFNRIVSMSSEDFELSAAYFWLGKVNQALGKDEEAQQNWQAAINQAPYGYYGVRSAELLEDRKPFEEPGQINLNVNLDDLRIPAGQWLRTAFNLPIGINLDYSSELYSDPRFIRALEFDRLGMFEQASAEFDSLRTERATSALDTFRLMKVFLDRGYFRSAIEASKTIAQLSGYSDAVFSASYPPYFTYVEFGAYYLPWIEEKSEKYKLPELMLLSVIHQESRFGAHAASGAGARGIMQLMPSTASVIANETGFLSEFTASDLDVPYYNLELGSNYLARMVYVFEGDYYKALAAYNAGPGNVMSWANLSGDDPDVLLNFIRYQEPRIYLRSIVEIFNRYRLIYGD